MSEPANASELVQSLTGETVQEISNLRQVERLERVSAIRSLIDDYLKLSPGRRVFEQEFDLYHQLGLLLKDKGEVIEAIRAYDKALELARKLENKSYQGVILGNLGLAYADLGEVRKAIEYYELSLRLYKGLEDEEGEAEQLNNLALAWERLGDREEAIKYAESALSIYKRIDSPEAEELEKRLEQWRGQASS